MTMKKTLILMLCVLLCLSAVGCARSYSSTVPTSKVVATALDALGDSASYIDGTTNYFEFYFAGNEGADKVTECSMMFHDLETNVNEFGVFRVASTKDVAAVESLVRSYLNDQIDDLRSFAANYSPEDMAKIDNADVTTMGTYVIYYILSPEDENAVLTAVEDLLAE